MSFRNTSFIHRPSSLRGRGTKRGLNAQYYEECSKMARKRTDAYLLKRWSQPVEETAAKMVVLKSGT